MEFEHNLYFEIYKDWPIIQLLFDFFFSVLVVCFRAGLGFFDPALFFSDKIYCYKKKKKKKRKKDCKQQSMLERKYKVCDVVTETIMQSQLPRISSKLWLNWRGPYLLKKIYPLNAYKFSQFKRRGALLSIECI